MSATKPRSTRESLLRAAVELIRRDGYDATRVDAICAEAGVSKGAFFHHFASKQALAVQALQTWDDFGAALFAGAPFNQLGDPLERLLGCMDFQVEFFGRPELLKSCLAGTVAQEVSATHPELRAAANACFVHAGERFTALLRDAAESRHAELDAAAHADLWMAALQGALVLAKASHDESVIPTTLQLTRDLIASRFDTTSA